MLWLGLWSPGPAPPKSRAGLVHNASVNLAMPPHSLYIVSFWLLLAFGVLAAVLLLLAHRTGQLRPIYRKHFGETPRERLFLASVSFFATFAGVRVITHAIRAGIGPLHDISARGKHIHHLVWGILLLLIVGYGWLAQVGTGAPSSSTWMGRVMAILYGMGAALTLDEFALWLNLRDVYWEREGRASVDAVLLFGGLLAVGVWGGKFVHALAREAVHLIGRRRQGSVSDTDA